MLKKITANQLRALKRIKKTPTRYDYDDQRVAVQTLVSGGAESDFRRYVFGNYIDEVLLRYVIPAQAGIQNHYYLHDHLYSPRQTSAGRPQSPERGDA